MKFGLGLVGLQTGQFEFIRLPHWSEDVKIKLQKPDENSKMTAEYLYVESRFGRVPWIPTQIELLSDRWMAN